MEQQNTPFGTMRSLRSLLFIAAGYLLAHSGQAQTATNTCTYAAGNQYTVASACTPQTFNKPNTFVNSFLPTGCGASTSNDAWGWFTATGTTTNITYTPGSGNPRIHLFSGACGSLTQLACVNANGAGVAETLTFATTVGVNYMVRIQSGDNNTMNGTLCIWSPPINDNPCAATALTVGTTCSAIAGTNVSATATAGIPAPGCAAYSTADVWYTFVAPAGGSINIETAPGTLTDGGVAIYSATACAGTYTLISCDDSNGPGNMGQAQATGLTPGVTYYARVWGNGGATGTFTICAHALANDNPCGATALTVGTSCTAVAGTNVNATGTTGIPVPGCAAYSTADVWYTFIAPAGGSINIETAPGTLTDGGVAIYSATACAGTYTLISCDDSNGPGNMGQAQATGLIPGVTYYARVWGNGGATGTFTICAHALANDNPCGAIALTMGSSCTALASSNVNATGTTGIPAPGCAAYTTADTWFTFVAPAGGLVTVAAEPAGLTNGGMALYSATACAGTFTFIECDDSDGTGDMPLITRSGLTPGLTYYVRMWGNGGATGTFTICAIDLTPPNDNPCGATALTVGTTCTNVTATNVNATGTSIASPGCALYNGADVWFSTVVPANGTVTVQSTAGTLTDGGLAAYTAAACAGTFTLLSCIDDVSGNLMPSMTISGQTPGTTLYWRFFGYNGATGNFSLCATTPPPPANDDPCGATVLTVGTTCTLSASTNVGATATAGVPAPGCAAYTLGDVWFQFVAPASGNILAQTTANSLTDGGMAIYSATACAGTFTLIECDDNDGAGNMPDIQRNSLIPGTTYYLRVWGNSGAVGTFNICVRSLPVNDEPCSATTLSVTTGCTTITGNNAGGTPTSGIPLPGCGGAISNDVWFTITAPASGFATVRVTPGTMTNPAIAIYAATSCSGGYQLLDCDDNNAPGNGGIITLTPGIFTPGQTYYVRIWSSSGAAGNFTLCAQTTTATCFVALRLFDTNDNGWGGSSVSVQVGGAAAVNYTLGASEGENTVYIPYINGQLIQVSYATGGAGNQNQISYFLQIGQGILYEGGPTPATGLVHASIPICGSLEAPQSDCSGGERLCSGTSFSANPSNTGAIVDLNVNTRGCLAADERQGSWYRFIPSAGGTIGMTIAPSNASDDYDFAIWGPDDAHVCPPDVQPLRCSFSGAAGNTGLGNGAADVTEGPGGDKWVAPMNVVYGEHYTMYISNFSRSGLSFNLTWQLTNGASLDCLILPVELLSFTGEAVERTSVLEWMTASESNSSHFVVERSTDGYTFAPIGEVTAAGTSNSLLAYSFVDQQPLRGTNYYRLKQVDLDGTTDLSHIVPITIDQLVTVGELFPNPTRDRINLELQLTAEQDLTFEVLDASGRLLQQEKHRFGAGTVPFSTEVGRLEPGTYLLLVRDANGETHQAGRFIVE